MVRVVSNSPQPASPVCCNRQTPEMLINFAVSCIKLNKAFLSLFASGYSLQFIQLNNGTIP